VLKVYAALARLNLVGSFVSKVYILVVLVVLLPLIGPLSLFFVVHDATPANYLYSCLAGTLLGIGIGIFMARGMMAPMLLCSDALNRFALHGERVPLPREYNDEAGKLMRHVDDMVTDIKARRDEIRQGDMQDELTELPNRRAALIRLQGELRNRRSHGPDAPLIVALVDIDGFRNINESFGYDTGDRVLATFARQMSQRIREMDFLARFEGEEFALILRVEADSAQSVLERLTVPMEIEELPYGLTMSAGFVLCTDMEPLEKALKRATDSLQIAKKLGRNRVVGDIQPKSYDPPLNTTLDVETVPMSELPS
jgi:diguanylate cyclase (GGDEF)-like protein